FADLPVQPAYDVGAVRARLEEMLSKMRTAASWPWKASTVDRYRERVWPALIAKLPDAQEAQRFRAEIEAEARRLDNA
ncbi:MAG TPA: hypothetical protein VG891_01515, partial [Rhizomicrobium sp.]|nr:hypothetical protein [Rhizomicrobium sp.]